DRSELATCGRNQAGRRLGRALERTRHLVVVQAAEIAEQERRPAVEPEHRKRALDGVDATGTDVIDLHPDRSGAATEHPADPLRAWWESLAVPAGASHGTVEGCSPVHAQPRRGVPAGMVDATGDEGHRVRLVIDQMGGIRD